MAISGTTLSLYSPAFPERRAEQPRVRDTQPLTLVQDTGRRAIPPRERVIEGEVVEKPAGGRYTVDSVFSRAFIEGAFRHAADDGPRPSRAALAAYQDATVLGTDDGPRTGRRVDALV